MGSLRQEKVSALLQGAIAQYFEEHKDELDIDGLVFVDEVFLAADLKSANVWVSFNPEQDSSNKFAALEQGLTGLQSHIFKQLTMKRVPKIKLHLSNSEPHKTLEKIFDTLESHGEAGEGHSGGTEKSQ